MRYSYIRLVWNPIILKSFVHLLWKQTFYTSYHIIVSVTKLKKKTHIIIYYMVLWTSNVRYSCFQMVNNIFYTKWLKYFPPVLQPKKGSMEPPLRKPLSRQNFAMNSKLYPVLYISLKRTIFKQAKKKKKKKNK